MNSKIEKYFQNSRFYKNYNNINFVFSKFQKIKNEYTVSKNKFKNKLCNTLILLYKNQPQNKILEKNIIILSDKFGPNIFENEFSNLFVNKINIDKIKLNSYQKILDKKIKLSKDIKKYVKYSKNINDDFIKSVKIRNIKNIYTLIKNGADIHVNDDYSFKLSSENGRIDVVKILVEKGANIHSNDDYALRMSSYYGHIEVVQFLIENGANVCANNDYALKWSSYNGHIEVVKILVKNGANIHADDDDALIWSSSNGHIKVVKYLVKNGANIHINNDQVIKMSSENEHIEIIKFLINSNLEYFSANELARKIVIKHKLVEFYQKFGIK
jgi:hypothetical protein